MRQRDLIESYHQKMLSSSAHWPLSKLISVMTSTTLHSNCPLNDMTQYPGLNGVAVDFHDHYDWDKLTRDLADVVSTAAT